MPILRVVIGGDEQLINTDSLMLSELEILEEFAGVDIEELNNAASLKKVRFIGHLLWLFTLRRTAAEQNIPLREAALKLPRDQFDISTGDVRMELVEAPKSSAGPRTPTTRTRRTGSSAPRKPSAKNGGGRSADSPST